MVSYAIDELFGEKLRALAERCRPRDLYDVIYLHRHPDLIGRAIDVAQVLQEKCLHVGIDVPTLDILLSTPFRAEIESEWENMLGHQLPKPLPPFESHWDTLDDVFGWLSGTRPQAELPRAGFGSLDQTWTPPVAIRSWRRGFPFELLRYAAADRLRVEIDYRAKEGRQGPRIVEPYALRRTRQGTYRLFVVNDRGLLRSYSVDRIAGVRPTTQTFVARFRVEL